MLTVDIKTGIKATSLFSAGSTTLAASQATTDCPTVQMTAMKPTQCERCLCLVTKCWVVCGGDADADSVAACFIHHIVVSQDIVRFVEVEKKGPAPTVEHKMQFVPRCVAPTCDQLV